MARLFVNYRGARYERRFTPDKVWNFLDQRGNVVAGRTAKALEEAMRPRKSRTPMELVESAKQAAKQEAAARRKYLALRLGKPNSTAISEADRVARRRDLHMAAGMSFEEAAIAARGRWERG